MKLWKTLLLFFILLLIFLLPDQVVTEIATFISDALTTTKHAFILQCSQGAVTLRKSKLDLTYRK